MTIYGGRICYPPEVSDEAHRRRQYAFVQRRDAMLYETSGGWHKSKKEKADILPYACPDQPCVRSRKQLNGNQGAS